MGVDARGTVARQVRAGVSPSKLQNRVNRPLNSPARRWIPTGLLLVAASTLLASAPRLQDSATSRLRFIPGSTAKVEQILGEEDKELGRPTAARTATRFGLEGTDLGNSFEHNGRVYFLFGDTVGSAGRALDTIGFSESRDPESGVRLQFLTMDAIAAGRRGRARRGGRAQIAPSEKQYLTIEPPGVSMGAFEVPVAGISLDNQMYVVVSTNHTDSRMSDRSVLTKFSAPAKFEPKRVISQLPAGRFVKMSLHAEPSPIEGLPRGGPWILMWGTGAYRQSDTYLAIVPAAKFETGQGTRYFSGTDAAGRPEWSERERDAEAIVRNGTMGDVSVTWCAPLGLWLMNYDSRPPARRGIMFSYSRTPWGPWSEPQVIFDPLRDPGIGKFIHNPRGNPPDRLIGPVIGPAVFNPAGTPGSAYAPYIVERWTKVANDELTIYYVISTWNPYVVVLMKSRLRVQ